MAAVNSINTAWREAPLTDIIDTLGHRSCPTLVTGYTLHPYLEKKLYTTYPIYKLLNSRLVITKVD